MKKIIEIHLYGNDLMVIGDNMDIRLTDIFNELLIKYLNHLSNMETLRNLYIDFIDVFNAEKYKIDNIQAMIDLSNITFEFYLMDDLVYVY